MKYIIVFICILFVNCSNNTLVNRHNLTKKNKIDKSDLTNDIIIVSIRKPEELSTLFYRNVVVKRIITKKIETKTTIREEKEKINASDYKVVTDWMVNNIRYVKLRNIKTGVETTVRDGDRSKDIILLERSLFYYKFQINNQIIEVNR